LRSSGRLFWLPYYVILAAVLTVPFWLLPKRWANLLVACALIFQWTDTVRLRRGVYADVHSASASPLESAVWNSLGALHKNLIVLPAYQCGGSPGGQDGFRTFGLLAVAQRMRTNSYNAARFTEKNRQTLCSNPFSELVTEPLYPRLGRSRI
jgi:hypothetical protein